MKTALARIIPVAIAALTLSAACAAQADNTLQAYSTQIEDCGASSAITGEITPAVWQQAIHISQDSEADTYERDTCSNRLLVLGQSIGALRKNWPQAADQPGLDGWMAARSEITSGLGRLVYPTLAQCYLQSQREKLIADFRQNQIDYLFAGHEQLAHLPAVFANPHAPFTGWKEGDQVDPAECSDLLVHAGIQMRVMKALALQARQQQGTTSARADQDQ